jgi:hypothetical protein
VPAYQKCISHVSTIVFTCYLDHPYLGTDIAFKPGGSQARPIRLGSQVPTTHDGLR